MTEKEPNYCYRHEHDICRDCKIAGGQCGYYCHRCACPFCADTFEGASNT
jgi:hypothetical protein